MKIAVHAGDFPSGNKMEDRLCTIKNIGIRYVEMPFGGKFLSLDNAAEVKKLLENMALVPCAVDTWLYFLDVAGLEENRKILFECIRVAKMLNVKVVRIGPFGSAGNMGLEEATRVYRKNIEPCIKKAEEENIVLVLENEFGDDPTRTALNCLSILESVNSESFKLLYDPCNFYIAGEEGYPYAYNLLKPWIGYVHVKDALKVKEWGKTESGGANRGNKGECMYVDGQENIVWKDGDDTSDYLCTAIGEGAINYDGLLKALAADGYAGFISVEPHVKESIHTETMRQTVDYLKEKGGCIS